MKYKSIDDEYDNKEISLESNDVDILEVDTQNKYVIVENDGIIINVVKVISFIIVTLAFIMIINKDNRSNGIMNDGNGFITGTSTLDETIFKITLWIESPTYASMKDLDYDIVVEPGEMTTFHVKKLKIDGIQISNFEDKYNIYWYSFNDTLIATGNDVDYNFEDEGVFDSSVTLMEKQTITENSITSSESTDSTDEVDSFTYDFTVAVEKYSKSKTKSKQTTRN